ncbi:hypothetical protein ACG2K1_06445 [Neisseria sp. 23W00296]|uniref:hypothetical protein n=1 Tax=unclassified Neisseria TaxID=2623750 RepID=UPI00375654A4
MHVFSSANGFQTASKRRVKGADYTPPQRPSETPLRISDGLYIADGLAPCGAKRQKAV